MDSISFSGTGSFRKTDSFLRRITHTDLTSKIKRYGELGAYELAYNTPIDSGETAQHWDYQAIKSEDGVTIYWTNDYAPYGVPVAKLLEYGHAARDGSWVPAQPFIKQTMEPIYIDMANDIWKEVVEE